MKKTLTLLFLFLLLIVRESVAQPFADLVSASYQTFSSPYKGTKTTGLKNKTDDYFLNLFLPKVFKNGNTFMIRLNAESITSTISPDSSYSYRVSSVSLPVGVKLVTKNKKWETILIGIPKIACDFRGKIDQHDYQLGGIFLQQYVKNPNLKLKLGLYYNREAFGNFFIPLAGIDWKANSRISFYGIMPTNYSAEYAIIKTKLYTGLNFKAFTRSFRLSAANNYDYVRYNEEQLKVFVNWFIYKKILLFAEAGYSLGKNPRQYIYNTKIATDVNPVYTPLTNYALFNVGVAYRIRFDFEKK